MIFESSGFNINVLSLGGLPLGIYNITIKNIGNDYYFGYNVSDTFKVVVPSSIIASDIGRGYNSPYDYVAVFTDDMGNPLSNMNVTMTVLPLIGPVPFKVIFMVVDFADLLTFESLGKFTTLLRTKLPNLVVLLSY